VLTQRLKDVLEFVVSRLDETGGVAPSLREIQDRFKFSSVEQSCRALRGLEERGFIERRAGKARWIKVLRGPDGKKVD